MIKRTSFGILFSFALAAQNLQPPKSLTVVTATNKQTQLKWTAGDTVATGYAVQRKVLGSDDSAFTTVETVPVPASAGSTTITYNDSSIDAYTAYVYRVLGTLQVTQSLSDPSNTVTVGPPPYGYNVVVPFPAGLDPSLADTFGNGVRMTLDTSGDPALAYLYVDPDQSHNFNDALFFVRWDRAHYQWTTPVQVAVVGEASSGDEVPVSIAQDSSNGMFGIAFEDETNPNYGQIGIAFSTDGGLTWKKQSAASDAALDQYFGYYRPSLAMGAGNVYMSFYHDFDGIRYVTGKETDAPSKWTGTTIPLPAAYSGGVRHYTSLALDSAGKPAVVFMAAGDTGEGEFFWRPGGSPVRVLDNNGFQNDFADVRLAFFGLQPRVAFAGGLDDGFFADYDHALWVISSPDNGTTWSAPVNVPSDLGTTLDGPITVALGSRGQAAIATEDNGGNGTYNCVQPKLAMSADLVRWTTCGLNTADGTVLSTAHSPQVAFAGNDTLLIGFQQLETSDENTALPLGVLFWRQPVSWSFPPPPPPQQ